KWIYLSSFLGKSFETQKELAKKLHARGTKIAFNPSYYLIEKKNLKEILEITEILILNKEEGRLLTKEKNLLVGLKKLGPKMVVVTDGEKPAYFYDGKRKISVHPNKVKVVEKTGAGDAFASGFVAGQIVGKSVEESLKLGLLESEAVIKKFGAKNNLIRRKLK
ncbi:MAG: carbohydrate kinase family protein, partial [Nanoarchaeota archaeon]|nr:carbohydrate kinase family protein [Nanoarchaeota archaeon]